MLGAFTFNPRGARDPVFRISRIRPGGVQRVADLTMPGDPSFVAAGIRVHNCWGCGKSRDAIETVIAKEGLTEHEKKFSLACRKLEEWYGLPPLPFDPSDEEPEPVPKNAVKDALEHDRDPTFERAQRRAESLLRRLTAEREVPLKYLLACWEVYDMVVFQAGEKGSWDQDEARDAMVMLRHKINQQVFG